MTLDTEKVSEVIRHVAATEVMPRFRNLQQGDILEKSPGDIVTVADEASEKVLTQLLQDILPGALVVGEEAVAKNISVLERLKDDKPVWIIDPIDGTTNYSKGREQFGIFVALVQKGVTQYGWAFDPCGNRMMMAQKGAGAFLNGQRITLPTPPMDLKKLVGQGDGAPAAYFDPVRPLFKELVRSGCALHDYLNLLTNKAQFITYVEQITPWDHAAANLLAEEAGAYVATDDDVPYDPTHYRPAFMLVAKGKALWDKLHPALYPLRK